MGGGGRVTGLSKYLKMCVARGAIRVEFFSIHASFTIVLFDSLRPHLQVRYLQYLVLIARSYAFEVKIDTNLLTHNISTNTPNSAALYCTV